MKFICLGYHDPSKWQQFTDEERSTLIDECFDYDDELRRKGHFAGGEALDDPATAKTLRYSNKRLSATDGPYAETREQLGGILILEADNLAHAVELMSKHPGVKNGPFEIRPAASLDQMIAESEKRRSRR
ncbi:MAG TPA: YciI family protein [Woeseiaceae bacterium]|nr:YciI family protein [Woeseiaceae bacterium]